MSFTDRKEEKDDFWDLDKLMPKKKGATLSPFVTKPTVRDYSADAPKSASNETDNMDTRAEERKLNLDGMRGFADTEDRVYYPENTLVKSITVKKYREKYDFYDNFRKAALLYHDCPGEKCDFAQFYSYMPQYSKSLACRAEGKENQCYRCLPRSCGYRVFCKLKECKRI